MVVGAMQLTLHLGQAASLKAKRKVLRSIIGKVQAKFNAAVSEVGAQDLWQRLEIGIAVCANEPRFAENQLEEIERYIERLALAEIVDVRYEVMNLKEMTWAPAARNDWPA